MEPVKPREGGRTHPGLTVVPPRIGDSRTRSVSRGNARPQIAYCHGSHTAAPLSGAIISSGLGLSSAVRRALIEPDGVLLMDAGFEAQNRRADCTSFVLDPSQ